MSKIFHFYAKNKDGIDTDFTWYDSSNVKYSECLDYDNSLKTLKVVFNNGTQYEYKNVESSKYLLFREDVSQGKALNKYIKGSGYEYQKLEDANMASLDEELEFRSHGGIFVIYDGDKFTMKDNKDKVIFEKDIKLTESAFNLTCSALEAVGNKIYTEGKNFIDNGENGENKPF